MTGPFKENIYDREHEKFVESPTRANKPAVEVVIGNAGDISTGSDPSIEIRNASEILSALKCLFSISANTVGIAKNNIDLATATVLGIAITAAQTNEATQVKTFGTLRDTSFSWANGTQLYLGSNGELTDTAPVSGFRTLVAVSQGPGAIQINIQEPITL